MVFGSDVGVAAIVVFPRNYELGRGIGPPSEAFRYQTRASSGSKGALVPVFVAVCQGSTATPNRPHSPRPTAPYPAALLQPTPTMRQEIAECRPMAILAPCTIFIQNGRLASYSLDYTHGFSMTVHHPSAISRTCPSALDGSEFLFRSLKRLLRMPA